MTGKVLVLVGMDATFLTVPQGTSPQDVASEWVAQQSVPAGTTIVVVSDLTSAASYTAATEMVAVAS